MKRNKNIDILKGIGICLIVLGHTNFFGKHFLYLFHVAIFIIASGLFFNYDVIKNKESLFVFIKKRIIGLYIPYVVTNIIFLIFNNFLIKNNIYSPYTHYQYNFLDYLISFGKILIFRGVTELGGASWFLYLLFLIEILYCLLSFILFKLLKNRKLVINFQLIISFIFLSLGIILSNYFGQGIFRIFISVLCCYYLYYFGNFFWYYKDKILNNYLIISIVSFLFLLVMCQKGSVEISKNIYTSMPFFVISSILGWYLLYSISKLIERCIVGNVLSYIGKKSIYILLFHFLSFKIVNCIVCLILNDDTSMMWKFPTSYGGVWIIIYVLFGIFIPIVISYINDCLKKIILKKAYINIETLKSDTRFSIDDTTYDRLFRKNIYKYKLVNIKLKQINKGVEDRIVPLNNTIAYRYLKNNASEKDYKNYLIHNSRDDEKHSIDKYKELISKFENYDPNNGIIIVDNYNILIDGQHRACLLLDKYGENYHILVLKVFYRGLHLKTLYKILVYKFWHIINRGVE